MIIGVTGAKASGKGEVAELFKRKGFIYTSLSDRVREEATARGMINYTTKDLQDVGNDLRERFGNGVLVMRTLKMVEKGKNYVIDGIRNIGEIEELKKEKDFFLIAVDAPQKKRFERLIKRGRSSDPKTLPEFLLMDDRDRGKEELNSGQQVEKCMIQAEFKIDNNGTLEELNKKADEILRAIIKRPTWDEYFMKMASLVAERSTCLRHNVGAVIVKGKRVMTTGYNGAASGQKDCIALGCLRNELGIPSGTRHEICRAIHAEQNAIIQAGVHGTNISEATLYCTHTPCMICAKMIVNSGIKEVISYQDYADEEARKFLETSGVRLRKMDRPIGIIGFKD
jgi:dCMP deaminase